MAVIDFQEKLYDFLIADSALMALVVGIYDNPESALDSASATPFPFVTIGSDSIKPWDTSTEEGLEIESTIHVWSRASHHLECKKIQAEIKRILHRNKFNLTDFYCVGCDLTLQGAQRDPDGITIHGVQTFKLIFREA